MQIKNIQSFVVLLSLLVVFFLIGCINQQTQPQTSDNKPLTPNPNLPLDDAVKQMQDFMQENPTDPSLAIVPVQEDQGFQGTLMKNGSFQRLNYMTSGTVMLEQKNGKTFVVLGDDFSTPNGPDLVVYLTKNSGPTQRSDISAGIELGKLKSTTGKQVFEVASIANVSGFNSVTIHCRAFNVPWSYAPLN